MNWLKVIFTSAVAIIFIGSTFIALFGAGEALNAVFRTYVFKVEQCRFDYPKRVVMPAAPPAGETTPAVIEGPEESCSVDYNETRRNIADGLARLAIGAPVALGTFWFTYKMMRNTNSILKKDKSRNKIARIKK